MNSFFSKGTALTYGIFRKSLFYKSLPRAEYKISVYNAFHNSVICLSKEVESVEVVFGETKKTVRLTKAQARKKEDDNVDWLPFPWIKSPMNDHFKDSGDLVKELEYDPSWPKPDFELSDELKTANEDIKHMYSLACASKREIKDVVKRKWLEKIQRHPNDTASLEVDIAMRTFTIRSVFEHAKAIKKERVGGRRVLHILILKRNKRLKFLYRVDRDRFNWLCKELKLIYEPKPLGELYYRERWTKKRELRRLTKEYCTKMIKDKKNAYHNELKQQQENFLKEKADSLAWIEKEEKDIANIEKELENLNVNE